MSIIDKGIFLCTLTIIFFPSCRQAKEMKTFSKCDFELIAVDNILLADVDITKVKEPSELSIMDGIRLADAVARGKVPLDLNLRIRVTNPNETKAAMNAAEWIVLADDTELITGRSRERVEIPPDGGTAEFTLAASVDLRETFSEESYKTILNFALNLAGKGKDKSRITLKLKPVIMIRGAEMDYPGYITVPYEF